MAETIAPEITTSETRHGLASILLVDDDLTGRERLSEGLAHAGFDVVAARSGGEALDRLEEATPDLVLTEVDVADGDGIDGFALVSRMRAHGLWRNLPVMMLTDRRSTIDIVTGLDVGADDYLIKPLELDELTARVRARLARRPIPQDALSRDARTGLLSAASVLTVVGRERVRAARTGQPGWLAVLELDETARLRERFGDRGMDQLAKQVSGVLTQDAQPLETPGRDPAGRFLFVVTDAEEAALRARLERLASQLAARSFLVAGERVTVTPVVGYVAFGDATDAVQLRDRACVAAQQAAVRRDLRPTRYRPGMEALAEQRRHPLPLLTRLRTPLQILATLVIGIGIPYGVYLLLGRAGIDVSGYIFDAVVAALVLSAASIWIEGLFALEPIEPPRDSSGPLPPASAVIAAYLPNEALTIVQTVEHFLRLDYPGELQVILAYNTPRPLPVESTLQQLAAQHPRLLLLHVANSTSKAQNVNAALPYVTGEFVGIFDADHHPAPGSFRRAWRWLAGGYGVVQGHCVVRNGDASWVARTVAVEFEAIYAVSHPGRARLHGFGVFGGSNGYWRTDLLRATRMRDSMLTEDIDSSLRVIDQGVRIASDPQLVSWELAPATARALWNQRMRWAQGWFQASRAHLRREMTSRQLTVRQKIGMSYLLGWREIYPWLALQIVPYIGYQIYERGSISRLNWLVPIFVLTALFTISVGPGQTLFAYRLAVPALRRRRWWFGAYLVMSSLVYTEWKNLIARTAQLKELTGDRQWRITPRAQATLVGRHRPEFATRKPVSIPVAAVRTESFHREEEPAGEGVATATGPDAGSPASAAQRSGRRVFVAAGTAGVLLVGAGVAVTATKIPAGPAPALTGLGHQRSEPSTTGTTVLAPLNKPGRWRPTTEPGVAFSAGTARLPEGATGPVTAEYRPADPVNWTNYQLSTQVSGLLDTPPAQLILRLPAGEGRPPVTVALNGNHVSAAARSPLGSASPPLVGLDNLTVTVHGTDLTVAIDGTPAVQAKLPAADATLAASRATTPLALTLAGSPEASLQLSNLTVTVAGH